MDSVLLSSLCEGFCESFERTQGTADSGREVCPGHWNAHTPDTLRLQAGLKYSFPDSIWLTSLTFFSSFLKHHCSGKLLQLTDARLTIAAPLGIFHTLSIALLCLLFFSLAIIALLSMTILIYFIYLLLVLETKHRAPQLLGKHPTTALNLSLLPVGII
jgi:hypothetical protein